VTNLICDASQYTRGTEQARSGNRALSGSIDSIIGQLERQKKALANANSTTQGNILKTATKGAGEGSINVALQLNDEVEGLKKLKAEHEALTLAKAKAKEAGESLIASLEREKATYGMTAAQIRIYTATQAGASAEDIRRANVLTGEINALRAAKEAQESLNQQTSSGRASVDGLTNKSMMLTASMQGLEDGIAGATNNGFKGFFQATTNNAAQLGALIGGVGGMVITGGFLAGMLGSVLIPKIYEWATATEGVTKKKEELAEASKKQYEQEIAQIIKLQNLRHDDIVDKNNLNKKTEEFKTSAEAQKEFESIDERRLELDKKRQAAAREQFELKKKPTPEILANLTTFGKEQLDKRRQEKIDAAKIEEADAIRESEKLFNQQKQLQKQIADMKILEGKRAGSEEWIAEQKLMMERRNEDKQFRQERLAKEKSQVSELRGFIGSPEADAKASAIEKARKGGLITDAEAGTLNAANKAKPETLPGNVAAIQAGTKEAYSAVLRAMKNNEQAKLQADAKKLAEEANTILERIEKNTAEKEAALLLEF